MTASQNPLSTAEYRSLLTAAEERSPRHGFTVYLLGHTGMRRGEAAQFVPDWFDSANQVIRLDPENSKLPPTSPLRTRSIPLSSDATGRIAMYVDALSEDAFHVTSWAISHRIKTIAQDTGLERVTPSLLRQTFASKLLERGVPEEVVAMILGMRARSLPCSWRSKEADFDQIEPLYGDLEHDLDTDGTRGEERSRD